MASIGFMIGGALVNALAFSGSNFLFSKLSDEKEIKRHDEAIEKLEAERNAWDEQRTERIDYINEMLIKQGHARQTFKDVDEAMREYYLITKEPPPPLQMPPKPQLYDVLDADQKKLIQTGELAIAGVGAIATGFFVYKFML